MPSRSASQVTSRSYLICCNVVNLPLCISFEVVWISNEFRAGPWAAAVGVCSAGEITVDDNFNDISFIDSREVKNSTHPQRLVFMTMTWSWKNWLTGQVTVLQNASGIGQLTGLGANAVKSAGVFARVKCQIRTPIWSQSMAKTAPPLFWIDWPKEAGSLSRTPQPELELTKASQLVLKTLPVNAKLLKAAGAAEVSKLHPWDVCSVIWLVVPWFTPSTISISPFVGQLSWVTVQNAGQREHPPLNKKNKWNDVNYLEGVLRHCIDIYNKEASVVDLVGGNANSLKKYSQWYFRIRGATSHTICADHRQEEWSSNQLRCEPHCLGPYKSVPPLRLPAEKHIARYHA